MTKTIVDDAPPVMIAQAIKTVNNTPGLRIKTGLEALWVIYKAPQHQIDRSHLQEKFGAFNAHFGWFCRRVAEQVGDTEPGEFALVDQSTGAEGQTIFTLKPSVVLAMTAK